MMTKQDFTFKQIDKDNIENACGLYYLMLDEIQESNELLPVSENIDIIRVLLENARDDQPSFGIYYEDQLVGISLYIYSPFRTKINTVNCLGTFILPRFRGLGLYIPFHEFIWDEFRVLGIEKIYGSIKKREEILNTSDKMGLEEEIALCKVL